MFDQILATLAKHVSLSQEEEKRFTNSLKIKSIRKKEFILNQGEHCKNIFYVNSGILRAYHMNEEGRESTIMFALADWWVTDMSCFVHGTPSQLSIQAIEDCEILQLSKGGLDQLFEDLPKFERFFRVIMQNAYIREQSRTIQNLSLPAKDRYENFIAKYPQIIANVTQKQIASYLGITPEFLSSLRAIR